MKAAALACLLCALLAGGGCGRAAKAAPAATLAMTGHLAYSPDPPVARRELEVCATLATKGGDPLLDAQVSLDARMPGMPHPPAEAVLAPGASGQYCGDVILVMGGRWALTVRVAKGGDVGVLTGDVLVRE